MPEEIVIAFSLIYVAYLIGFTWISKEDYILKLVAALFLFVYVYMDS